MANIVQMKDSANAVFYPQTHEKAVIDSNGVNLQTKLQSITTPTYVTAWDGASTPVVANIPAGVSVTYNTTTYTGTLAASASTANKTYLVSTGTTDNYNRYVTQLNGSTYSWQNIGSTEIDLSDYATKAELNQLDQKVDDFEDYATPVIDTYTKKEIVNISSINNRSYSIKTTGTYGTSNTYKHKLAEVAPGAIVSVTAPSGYATRFCFVKSLDAPVSGGSIDLCANQSVVEISAGVTEKFVAPVDAVAYLFYCGSSPYNETPSNIETYKAIGVVDNLETSDPSAPLSANQGVVLNEEISQLADRFIVTENIVQDVRENKYWKTSNLSVGDTFSGNSTNSNGQYSSLVISCQPGNVFKFYGIGSNNNAVKTYVITDSSDKVLVVSSIETGTDYRTTPFDIVIPENGAKLYVNFSASYDSTTDKLVKYAQYVGSFSALSNRVSNLEGDVSDLQGYPLNGKTVVCFGDSLTELIDPYNKSWTDYFATQTRATVINVGIGGAQIRKIRQLADVFDETKSYTTGDRVSYDDGNGVKYYEFTSDHSAGAWDANDVEEMQSGWQNSLATSALSVVAMVEAACGQDFTRQEAAADWLAQNVGDDNTAVVDRLKNIDWTTVDAVVIFAGTNDWNLNEGNNGVSGGTDDKKTIEALNIAFRLIPYNYHKIQVFYCTPVIRYIISGFQAFTQSRTFETGDITLYLGNLYQFTADHSAGAWNPSQVRLLTMEELISYSSDTVTKNGMTLKDFSELLKIEAEKNHIPVCDLQNTLWNAMDFQSKLTGDLTHPRNGFNELGTKIASFVIANKRI